MKREIVLHNHIFLIRDAVNNIIIAFKQVKYKIAVVTRFSVQESNSKMSNSKMSLSIVIDVDDWRDVSRINKAF